MSPEQRPLPVLRALLARAAARAVLAPRRGATPLAECSAQTADTSQPRTSSALIAPVRTLRSVPANHLR
jgi:hypothetical protein